MQTTRVAAGARNPPREGSVRVSDVTLLHHATTALNNHRHIEGHEAVAQGWVCGDDRCRIAFQRLRGADFANHLKHRHSEVKPKNLPAP